jgi:putative ABC transport system permease protein
MPSPNIGSNPWYREWRSGFKLRILARVAPGTANAWLSAVATTAFRRAERANTSRHPDSAATVLPGPVLESLGPSIQPRTQVAIATRLIGVVVIVLLIACANVANLLIVRGLRRRREIAVRLALGVSRSRLVSQLLIESLVIALIAGVVAIIVGVWGGDALRRLIMPQTHWAGSPLDWWVVAATGAIALVTGVLAGVAPALQSSRPNLSEALKSGTHGSGRQRSRLRTSLIVVQAALSVVLLAGAGLFVRSLHDVQQIDVGYDVDHLVYAMVNFVDPEGHYIDRTGRGAELAAGMPMAAARIAALPGVEGTALATAPPMGGYAMTELYFENGTLVPRPDDLDPAMISVTPSFFATSGVRLLSGRLFAEDDRAETPRVVVVNETAAKRYWPGRNAIGECLRLFTATGGCMRVVGVTQDSHLSAIVEKPQIEMYVPLARQGTSFLGIPRFMVIRADPSQMAHVEQAAQREFRRVFPTADPPVVSAVSTLLEPELRPWRLGATLFSAFGLLALVVSAVGIYSVVAYSVSERVNEMGVRIALGAQHLDVVRLVVGQGMRTVVAGIVLGILTALALGRFVASMLYGTSPHDPLVLGVVALVLASIACLASLVPAIRAAATDPATALRSE